MFEGRFWQRTLHFRQRSYIGLGPMRAASLPRQATPSLGTGGSHPMVWFQVVIDSLLLIQQIQFLGTELFGHKNKMSAIGSRWTALSDEDKEPYQSMADDENARDAEAAKEAVSAAEEASTDVEASTEAAAATAATEATEATEDSD